MLQDDLALPTPQPTVCCPKIWPPPFIPLHLMWSCYGFFWRIYWISLFMRLREIRKFPLKNPATWPYKVRGGASEWTGFFYMVDRNWYVSIAASLPGSLLFNTELTFQVKQTSWIREYFCQPKINSVAKIHLVFPSVFQFCCKIHWLCR